MEPTAQAVGKVDRDSSPEGAKEGVCYRVWDALLRPTERSSPAWLEARG